MVKVDYRGSVDSLSFDRLAAIQTCTPQGVLGELAEAGLRDMAAAIGDAPTPDALNAWQARHDIGLLVRPLQPGGKRRAMLAVRRNVHLTPKSYEAARVMAVRLNGDLSLVLGLALERGAQIVDAGLAGRYPEYRRFRDALAELPDLGMQAVHEAVAT